MPLTRALMLLALVIATALGLTFVALGQDPEPGPSQPVAVAWDERPDSVPELDQAAVSVVEAEVTGIDAGPSLVDPADPGSEHHAIPTQRIAFDVLSVLDGPSPGDDLLLFKTGSEDAHLEGDPPYEAGERYVLFLRPREGEPGTYLPIAPDGRVRLNDGDEGHLFIAGSVKQELEGATVAEIEEKISE